MKKKDSLALAVFLLLGNIAMSSAQENTGDQDRFFYLSATPFPGRVPQRCVDTAE